MQHKAGSLFTANATGAKHGDLGIRLGFQLFAHEVWKPAKTVRMRINRALESADVNFIGITRVD